MNKKKIILVLAVVVVAIVLVNIFSKEDDYELDSLVYTNEISSSQEEAKNMDNTNKNENLIKIHIIGEVVNPGLIELDSGSRVLDAIEKAGGITELADPSKVNLAYILSDGEKIYIPSINDENETEYIIGSTNSNSKVNINTASVEQLQMLSGVGESTAQSIIDYRQQNGKFSDIEDIKNVSGIGENKYNKIKDSICIK